jgi:hypothetical protein
MPSEEVTRVDKVIIGVDPHKLSVTIEARDSREILRAKGRFGTDTRSYRQLLAYTRQWPERIWAVEGANGIGRPLAQRLLASGERVLDVPAKLAAPGPGLRHRPGPQDRPRRRPRDRHGRVAGQAAAGADRRSRADSAAVAV